MNIFYLHEDPAKSAEFMYNKHVIKMVTETAQILSTVHRILDGEEYIDLTKNGRRIKKWRMKDKTLDKLLYKSTHPNHPSVMWARESFDNYFWLYQHFIALGEEYTKRYKKQHLSITKLADILYNVPKNIETKGFTKVPQFMDEKYFNESSIDAYWNYYIGVKHTIAEKDEIIYTKKPF